MEGKKESKIFKKFLSVCTKKLHKMKLKKIFFDTWKKKIFHLPKLDLSPQNFRYDVLYPLYSVCIEVPVEVLLKKIL